MVLYMKEIKTNNKRILTLLSNNIGVEVIVQDSGGGIENSYVVPDGDIVKIGYGLGCDREDVSDALRLVIVSQRQREAADVFEAALELASNCTATGTYSNKGKID